MEWHHFHQHYNEEAKDIVFEGGDCHPSLALSTDEDLGCNSASEPSDYSSLPPKSKPLYENSDISLHDSLVTILSFITSAHLSGQDFTKFLDLLHLLLPKPNYLPKTRHSFFKVFKNDAVELKIVYYCNICWGKRESIDDKCTVCKDSKVRYFINCPLVPQIQKLYRRPGFVEKLNYKYIRTKIHPNNIEDVYDGAVYKEAEQNFLIHGKNISLTWYTDGVSLFECSSYSLWPFVFVINELPPEERYKEENLIIGGLWGDSEKPHPNMFLLPLYSEVKKLKEGFTVKCHDSDEDMEIKVIVLQGTCDMPAKASFMNMKGHAGYESCPKCFIEGEKSVRTGNVMVFTHKEDLELRNDDNYRECVQRRVESGKDFKGVFGPSLLSFMVYGSFIRSISIDSMHALFLGIVKQLLKLFFKPKYSSEPFSLVPFTDKVNSHLRKFQLPHFVERLPEDVTKLHFWKASLCRNFLLYFMKVIFKDIMKPDYFENLCLLIDGVALLHQSSISLSDLTEADSMLNHFCKGFQRLYGVRHMSSNIHLLRHLSSAVFETGPLQLTSCYRFEDLNGKIADLVHGTIHATKQIFSKISILAELPLLVGTLCSDAAKQYCHRLRKRRQYLPLSEKIADHVYIVGNLDSVTQHNDNLSELLTVLCGHSIIFQTFARLYKHKVLYVSSSYGKGSRLSSFCKYNCVNGVQHGKILTFVRTAERFPKYFALLSRVSNVNENLLRYVQCNAGDITTTDLIPIQHLICVSFCLSVDAGCSYVVDPLNMFEME